MKYSTRTSCLLLLLLLCGCRSSKQSVSDTVRDSVATHTLTTVTSRADTVRLAADIDFDSVVVSMLRRDSTRVLLTARRARVRSRSFVASVAATATSHVSADTVRHVDLRREFARSSPPAAITLPALLLCVVLLVAVLLLACRRGRVGE